MGHVFVTATVTAKRSAKVEFLVDTGATNSLVSPSMARKLGLASTGIRDSVRLANGKSVRVPVHVGMLRIDGRQAATMFWVGPCDQALLGVEALEGLGMMVDPIHGCLKPTRPYAKRLGGFGRR